MTRLMVEPLDEARIAVGLDALAARCAAMKALIARVGSPAPRIHEPGFATLLRIMVGQQLSVKAAAAIWERLEEKTGGAPTPAALTALDDADLQAVGFSRAKIRYGRTLAKRASDGALALDRLAALDDEAAQDALMAEKGVGRWTAEVYLLFALGRADVMPASDLALQVAAARLFALEARPTPDALRTLAEPWRPWRSVAALVLWRAYGVDALAGSSATGSGAAGSADATKGVGSPGAAERPTQAS